MAPLGARGWVQPHRDTRGPSAGGRDALDPSKCLPNVVWLLLMNHDVTRGQVFRDQGQLQRGRCRLGDPRGRAGAWGQLSQPGLRADGLQLTPKPSQRPGDALGVPGFSRLSTMEATHCPGHILSSQEEPSSCLSMRHATPL